MGSGKGNQKRVSTKLTGPGSRDNSRPQPRRVNSIHDAFPTDQITVADWVYTADANRDDVGELTYREYYLPNVTEEEFKKNFDDNMSYILTETLRDVIDKGLFVDRFNGTIGDAPTDFSEAIAKLNYNDYKIKFETKNPGYNSSDIYSFALIDIKNNEVISGYETMSISPTSETPLSEASGGAEFTCVGVARVLIEKAFKGF